MLMPMTPLMLMLGGGGRDEREVIRREGGSFTFGHCNPSVPACAIPLGAAGQDRFFLRGGILSITARRPVSAVRALRGGQPGRRACRAAACAAAGLKRKEGKHLRTLLDAVQCQALRGTTRTGNSHSRVTHTWRVL